MNRFYCLDCGHEQYDESPCESCGSDNVCENVDDEEEGE